MSWEDPVYGTCQVTEPAGDGTYRCTSFIVIRKCGAIARFTQLHVYDLRASPRTSKEPSASGG
ncbi:MAG: hypothetical protein II774_05315, partial [Lachnospiraceae bacterium]|nr:hypothetical protein [Lachnospiraceae bacterium]